MPFKPLRFGGAARRVGLKKMLPQNAGATQEGGRFSPACTRRWTHRHYFRASSTLPPGASGMDSLPHGALGKIQLIVAISGKCPQNLFSLAARVVNDKDAIVNIPKRERLKLFRRCRLRPKFQVDHTPHLEACAPLSRLRSFALAQAQQQSAALAPNSHPAAEDS
jgi:hypothetical protein